jgi:hypothetical protein
LEDIVGNGAESGAVGNSRSAEEVPLCILVSLRSTMGFGLDR